MRDDGPQLGIFFWGPVTLIAEIGALIWWWLG